MGGQEENKEGLLLFDTVLSFSVSLCREYPSKRLEIERDSPLIFSSSFSSFFLPLSLSLVFPLCVRFWSIGRKKEEGIVSEEQHLAAGKDNTKPLYCRGGWRGERESERASERGYAPGGTTADVRRLSTSLDVHFLLFGRLCNPFLPLSRSELSIGLRGLFALCCCVCCFPVDSISSRSSHHHGRGSASIARTKGEAEQQRKDRAWPSVRGFLRGRRPDRGWRTSPSLSTGPHRRRPAVVGRNGSYAPPLSFLHHGRLNKKKRRRERER